MKRQSFHEILVEKMTPQMAEEKPSTVYNELLENIAPLFQFRMEPMKTVSFKAYPAAAPKKKPAPPVVQTAPAKPKEAVIAKSSLSDEEKSVWNLFEKTVGKNLGDSVTRPQAMSAFRSFAKKNHPDVAAAPATTNFAYVVKVKNEMLSLLDKKIKTQSV